MSWTEADVPDQSDRVAVVTGANTGIGYDTARVLAQHGAVVVLGCRNQAKAKDAATQIAGRAPRAQVEVLDLDLSDLSSVRAAAETVASTHDRIDLLVNNAGVRMTPYATTRTNSSSSSPPTTSDTSPSRGCCSIASWRRRGHASSPSQATSIA